MKRIMLAFAAVLLVCLFMFTSCRSAGPDSREQARQTIDTLSAFTRLYGYVKYFYPGDEAAKMDWDRFAIYGAQKVEAAPDSAQLKKVLEDLFLPIAPALVIHEIGQKTAFSIDAITPPGSDGMNVIAWQHYGVGFGSLNSIYRSHRVNRKTELVSKAHRPAIFTQCREVPSLRGKEFKFSASVKVTGGHVQLWFREDRSDKEKGFFDNMSDRPVKSPEWSTYEISGQFSDAPMQICFGAMLFNGGQAWIDNFRLQIKEDGKWVDAADIIKNPDFETGKVGQAPQNWRSSGAGFVFKTLAGDAIQGKQCLSITHEAQKQVLTGPLFDEKPAIGEFITKDLGAGLSILMPIALYGSETQTFPVADKEKLENLLTAIKTTVPEELTGENLYVRLGNIVIAWNIFQHFYPYWDAVDTDWPAQLPKAFNSAYNDKSALDFRQTLRRLVATLKDGHGGVYSTERDPASHAFPFIWEWIENQLVVTRVEDRGNNDVQVGDVVLEIDGVNALNALLEVEQYISAGTEGLMRWRSTSELAYGKQGSRSALKLKRGDNTHEVSIERSLPVLNYRRMKHSGTEKYKTIGGDIHYMHLGLISMKDIREKFPELEKAKGIICDLRGYPNGNHQLITHLLKEKDSVKWMFTPMIIYPDHEKVRYREHGWYMNPAEPHLSAKTVFITDGRAISYAESYMGYIKGYKLATIVGQPTAGANGNVNPFTLPGGFRVVWTGMRVLKHDGSQHHAVGVLPDVPVQRTIRGVMEGRDEFLEKAIEIVKQVD